jgi:hypothetical protein
MIPESRSPSPRNRDRLAPEYAYLESLGCDRGSGVSPSLRQVTYNLLGIAHSVQHADDLNRLGLRIVNDEVGVDGPEFHGTAGEVLANMTRPGLVAEKLETTADILKNPARDRLISERSVPELPVQRQMLDRPIK